MANKLSVKLAVMVTTVILFGGTAYLGHRFIHDVSTSAEQIKGQEIPHKDVLINNDTLSAAMINTVASDLTHFQAAPDGVSSGRDVLIKAGEFWYEHGVPQVKLALFNQGQFTAGGVFLRLSLYIDGNQLIGEPVMMQAEFNQALSVGQNTQTSLVINNQAWQTRMVAEAKNRRLVAQIIAVNDKDNGGADYPQTSAGVLLRQTANDWSKPFNPNESIGVILNETASQIAQGSPNIDVIAEQSPVSPEQLKQKDPEDITEFLDKPLPTGEPRILSVQVEEYRDGKLVQPEHEAAKEKK